MSSRRASNLELLTLPLFITIQTAQQEFHLAEEVDRRVRVLDKHLRAEPQFVANQSQILGVHARLTVGRSPLQRLHAPETALSTRRHRSDTVLSDVDDIVLLTSIEKTSDMQIGFGHDGGVVVRASCVQLGWVKKTECIIHVGKIKPAVIMLHCKYTSSFHK